MYPWDTPRAEVAPLSLDSLANTCLALRPVVCTARGATMEEDEEEQEVEARVAMYEGFVEGRLKKDLQRAMDER